MRMLDRHKDYWPHNFYGNNAALYGGRFTQARTSSGDSNAVQAEYKSSKAYETINSPVGQAVGAGSPESNAVDRCIKCRLFFFTKV